MTSPESAKPRVAIIGAGITGLLTAQGLQKNGFKVTVFEREASTEARPRDWTILIHWGMPILERLLPAEVFAHFPDAICNPYLEFNEKTESLPCLNGVTGEPLFTNPTPGGRRITRQKLRKVLVEGIDIRWGKSLSELSSGDDDLVRLTFADGETFEADCVLGTDGTSSRVRQILVGDDEAAKPLFSGFMFATGICQYRDLAKVKHVVDPHPVATIVLGTTSVGGFGVMSVDKADDMTNWYTFWVNIWKGSEPSRQGKEAIEYIKQISKDTIEPMKSAIYWTPDDSQINIDEMKYWVTVPYDNHAGRVTLAGDAAHPMLPYRGQGLQHAITDANNYVEALLKIAKDPSARQDVMSAYDAEMVERGANAVHQSLKEAELSLDINTVNKMLMVRRGHGRVDDDDKGAAGGEAREGDGDGDGEGEGENR